MALYERNYSAGRSSREKVVCVHRAERLTAVPTVSSSVAQPRGAVIGVPSLPLVKRLPRNTEVSADTRYIQLVSRLLQHLPSPCCEAGLLPFGHDPSDPSCRA